MAVTTNGDASTPATYHDTPDGRLTRADIQLRRRMENGVGVWEATVGGRTVTAPGGPADLPKELANVLVAALRGARLVEVARLRSGDGVALLEGQHVLRRYADEGAALGEVVLTPPPPRARKRAPAVDHVRAYLRGQVAAIERADPAVRLGDDVEAVHDLRVALRRSRAILKVSAPAFEAEWVAQLVAELRWAGSTLAEVRNLDVLIEDLRADDIAGDREIAPIVKRLERDRRAARRRALAALTTERYLALLDALRAAADHPPVRKLDIRVDRLAARAFDRLRRAVDALGPRPSDEALHKTRIRAKRARYAAELARPTVGRRADAFVTTAKRFQDVVGGHQDAVEAERRLRALADAGGTAFGAGRLVERERERKRRARRDLPKAWRRLERRGRKVWS